MKPALISFAVTAALLTLHLLPSAWGTAGPPASAFSERHASENQAAITAEYDLDGTRAFRRGAHRRRLTRCRSSSLMQWAMRTLLGEYPKWLIRRC